jgi:hypothetical protein
LGAENYREKKSHAAPMSCIFNAAANTEEMSRTGSGPKKSLATNLSRDHRKRGPPKRAITWLIDVMPEAIKTGSILIKDGTFLPDALRFDSEPCATGWRLVKDLDGYGLHRKINEAEWTFFCLASEIKATIFGFDGQKTVRRAVKRILANLKSSKFNALEITRVASKSFLGVPYVNVSACSRHIQESLYLFCGKDSQELGSSEIDCRPDQSMGPAGSEVRLKGTTIQADVAPILNR